MREIFRVYPGNFTARCPLVARALLRAHLSGVACVGLLLTVLAGSHAYATVQSEIGDDIWPTDNPFTFEDEGLPNLGSQIDPGKAANAAAQGDPRMPDDYGDLPLGYDPPYFESRLNVIVGRTGSATLVIDAQSQLRYEHLIIGEMFGSEGNVRIQGVSSLYNNNYLLLPAAIGPDNQFGIVWGESIREQDGMEGFDLYVGQGGGGTLELLAGGRAEIQDAVSVGDLSGSVGVLTVDGTGSFLSNGGFMATGPMTGTQIHQFYVGRQGTGTVRILNGGKISSRGPESGTGGEVTAVVIGSDQYDGAQEPDGGGNGYVEMDGVGSAWIIGGDLQVGGFHANHALLDDPEGANATYLSNVGEGTLLVKNGALVNIVSPVDTDTGPAPNELSLLIGRRGTVDLQGGRIVMQGGFDAGSDPPIPFIEDVQVINDGLITGDGSIETGAFNNRYLGQVRVFEGQKLKITSTAGETIIPPLHRNPLANWGVIEVLGTEDAPAELEFVHSPAAGFDPPDAGPGDPVTPVNLEHAFRNLRLETPIPTPYPDPVHGGLISARHATLRFGSGLDNHGLLFFADGLNYVTGNVFNASDLDPEGQGVILLNRGEFDDPPAAGGTTRAIFENDVINAGTIVSRFGTQLEILGRHSFTTSGNLNVEISGPSSANIYVAGDVALDGTLDFQLGNDLLTALSHGDVFEIISFDGEAYRVNLSDPLHPLPDFGNVLPDLAAAFTVIEPANFDLLFPTLDPIAQRIGQSVFLSFMDPSLVGMGAIGADFNGDGVVDAADLAIIELNFGIEMGASILQGDANGDGIVNARDIFVWLEQQGGPGMAVPGGGAGAGAGGVGSVPEPSSIALLLSGGMLALIAARRRRGGSR